MAVGYGVVGANALAGAWGAVAWLRGAPSQAFWYLLRAAQAVVVVQVALGLLLLASGAQPPDQLHYVYGLGPLLVTLVTEAMRAGAAHNELARVGDVESLSRDQQAAIGRRVLRREMGIMAVGALLIVTLALRAVLTGAGG
jgi:hypothetical protein